MNTTRRTFFKIGNHKRNGLTPDIAYVHGELFGVGGVKTDPDNPRGPRTKSIENRCKPRGEWNTYGVVAVDERHQAVGERQVRQRHPQHTRSRVSLNRLLRQQRPRRINAAEQKRADHHHSRDQPHRR